MARRCSRPTEPAKDKLGRKVETAHDENTVHYLCAWWALAESTAALLPVCNLVQLVEVLLFGTVLITITGLPITFSNRHIAQPIALLISDCMRYWAPSFRSAYVDRNGRHVCDFALHGISRSEVQRSNPYLCASTN